MTGAAAIVTALGDGPATARELSQCLPGISYTNIRQLLRRLADAGAVTKLRRGLYSIGCDTVCCDTPPPPMGRRAGDETAEAPAIPPRQQAIVTRAAWAAALSRVRADFEAMNNPHDERAWA